MRSPEFSVTFLGTSAASINPCSPTSTCLVELGSTRLMVDVGVGALRQLRRAHMDADRIDAVLITHWHFDHFAGLPALLRARKRTTPTIYGPRLSMPSRIYLSGLFHSPRIHLEAMTDSSSTDCGDFLMETVGTAHDIVSLGWVLTERATAEQRGRRRIVISGDTRPTQGLIDAARGADLLVHEATYLDEDAGTASAHQHSTVTEAANVAVQAGVGALALTHLGHRYSKLSALTEAKKIFPPVMVPSMLDRIYIEPLACGDKKEGFGWGRVRIVPMLNSLSQG